jgi:hypothetical protein
MAQDHQTKSGDQSQICRNFSQSDAWDLRLVFNLSFMIVGTECDKNIQCWLFSCSSSRTSDPDIAGSNPTREDIFRDFTIRDQREYWFKPRKQEEVLKRD